MISTAAPSARAKLVKGQAPQPTLREIRQRMARIRQSWSPDERALRARHHRLRLGRLAVALMLSSAAPLTSEE